MTGDAYIEPGGPTRRIRKIRRNRMHRNANGRPKIAYTFDDALKAAHDKLPERVNVYKCWCGKWHIGQLKESDGPETDTQR